MKKITSFVLHFIVAGIFCLTSMYLIALFFKNVKLYF